MAMFLGVLWTVSYRALGDEIELQSLKRASTGFSGVSPDLVRINSATRSTLSPPTRDMEFTRYRR